MLDPGLARKPGRARVRPPDRMRLSRCARVAGRSWLVDGPQSAGGGVGCGRGGTCVWGRSGVLGGASMGCCSAVVLRQGRAAQGKAQGRNDNYLSSLIDVFMFIPFSSHFVILICANDRPSLTSLATAAANEAMTFGLFPRVRDMNHFPIRSPLPPREPTSRQKLVQAKCSC